MTIARDPCFQAPGREMTDFAWRIRVRAALIHLAGSILVAALAATLVFTLWYPWPYRIVSGGSELFALLVSVDVVLGPLITLAIFDRRKPWVSLRRDLCVVVLLQVIALGYGLHTTFIARPVVLALEGDRFRAVQSLAVVAEELPSAPEPLPAPGSPPQSGGARSWSPLGSSGSLAMLILMNLTGGYGSVGSVEAGQLFRMGQQ